MKTFARSILFLSFVFCFFGAAQAHQILVDDIPVASESLKQLDAFFVENGFNILKNRLDFNVLPEIDRLYVKTKTDEKIFLKAGVFVEKKNSVKLYPYESGYLSNFQYNKKSFVLYFSGFETSKIKSLKNGLGRSVASHSLWSRFLVQPAYADYVTCDNDVLPKLKNISGRNGLLWGTWGCLKGSGLGLWNSTGGAIADVAKIGWSAASSAAILLYCAVPIKTTELTCQQWSDQIFATAEKNVKQISDMLTNFNQVLSQSYPAFKQQDSDTKSKIICEVVSTMGISTALAFASVGGVTAGSVLKIHQVMEKLNLKKLNASGELAYQVKEGKALIEKLINKLSELSPEAANKLTKAQDEFRASINATVKIQAEAEILREDILTVGLINKAIELDDKVFLKSVLREETEVFARMQKENPGRIAQAKLLIIKKDIESARKKSEVLRKTYYQELDAADRLIAASKLSAVEKKALRSQTLIAKCSMMESTLRESQSVQVEKAKRSISAVKKTQ